MRAEINEYSDLDDRGAFLNQDQTDLSDIDTDEDDEYGKKKEKEKPASEPAEEHLITEEEQLKENPPPMDYEDTDQGPEEIDPVNHPGDFHYIPSEKPQNR